MPSLIGAPTPEDIRFCCSTTASCIGFAADMRDTEAEGIAESVGTSNADLAGRSRAKDGW
ncbi:MAG: hypothetical protein PVF43_05600 [Candidatus Eiseniibacteriota bacterium]|jgi:hypothetical protein